MAVAIFICPIRPDRVPKRIPAGSCSRVLRQDRVQILLAEPRLAEHLVRGPYPLGDHGLGLLQREVLLILPAGIVLGILGGEHTVLIRHLIPLLDVPVQRHLIQIRNLFVQPLEVALIRLLSYPLGIAVPVASGHGLSLSHGVHHGHPAALDVLILQLLVHGIGVHVIGEILPVCDLVIQPLDLILILALIAGGKLLLLLGNCRCRHSYPSFFCCSSCRSA